MTDRRKKLSEILHDILGSDNVYFDPPESIKMKYPAIVYTRAKIDTRKADNLKYLSSDRFEVTFIHKDADNSIVDAILDIPYASMDRMFKVNDLRHDVFTVYIQ
jgi:hypothetical protein